MSNLLAQLGGAGIAAGAGLLAMDAGKSALSDIAKQQATAYGDVVSGVEQAAQFKPYTVTSGAGKTTLGAEGLEFSPNIAQQQLTSQATGAIGQIGQPIVGLSGLGQQAFQGAQGALDATGGAFASGLGGLYAGLGEEQIAGAIAPSDLAMLQSQFAQQATGQQASDLGGMTGAIQQQAMGMLGQATPTAQSVYDQIRAMQSPEEERQRMALENRLAAQGRLGVTTSAYGGTPEQLALEKAQAEARNMASLQAMQQADQLASSQQARAAQMAQLGMSAEQIEDQLQSSALQRGLSSGQLAGQLAQTGAGIEAQQQQLGQGLLGLGLQAQQLGGQLGMQDVQRAQALSGIGQQATMLPVALEQAQLANIAQGLSASGIPLQQQMAAAQMGMSAQQAEAQRQQNFANLIANLGISEAGLMKDLALGGSTLTQEYIKSLGNIGAGVAGMNFEV